LEVVDKNYSQHLLKALDLEFNELKVINYSLEPRKKVPFSVSGSRVGIEKAKILPQRRGNSFRFKARKVLLFWLGSKGSAGKPLRFLL